MDLCPSRRACPPGLPGLLLAALISLTAAYPVTAEAQTYECGYYVLEPGYIANGAPGDILLTRVEGSPAGAVTDPLGQTYTHAGMLMSQWTVRHNTSLVSSRSIFEGTMSSLAAFAAAIGQSEICYVYGWVPASDLRRGEPGLESEAISNLPGSLPWNPSYLALLKPRDEGWYRTGAAASARAMQGISGMVYDVHSYKDYSAAIGLNGSMCSGSVKHATDLSGYGGFDLVRYSNSEINTSASSLYNFVYNRARAEVDRESRRTVLGVTFYVLSAQCRQYMAAGMANEVVSCFTDGQCNRGGLKDYWQSYAYWQGTDLGEALSISPDNLIDNQPNSLYSPVVAADYRASRWVYVSRTCTCGGEEDSLIPPPCPSSSDESL
jgi:hypothetical protein